MTERYSPAICSTCGGKWGYCACVTGPQTATPWTWVQPKNQAELLTRLADARDLDMTERERENLCACAYTEITRLQREILRLSGLPAENAGGNSTRLCGAIIYVGDAVKVRYTTGKRMKGGILAGVVTKVWPFQAEINNGWCFHDGDDLLEHTRGEDEQ